MWDRDEMRREGACEVGGKWDATCEASRQPSVFMLLGNQKRTPLGAQKVRWTGISLVPLGFEPRIFRV